MSFTPENNEFASARPEVRHAKERLQSLGELLIDASTLIELLHTKHQADYIDYTLTFPVLPYSTAVLPSVFTAENPDYIVVTAGINKANENHPAISSTAIDIVTPTRKLKIVRDTTTIDSEDGDEDVLIDIETANPSTGADDETVRLERGDELQAPLIDVPRVPRREVNALLMSLALPDKGEYMSFKDKKLFEGDAFVYLIETLRFHAIEANTSGFYTFRDGSAELNFTKNNDNVSFYMNYMDPRTGIVMIANIDTQTGFVLNFSSIDSSKRAEHSPSSEDIELFRSIINDEITAITHSSEVDYDTTHSADAEKIAVDHIEKQEQTWQSIQDMYEASDSDQDGFDTPNAGA